MTEFPDAAMGLVVFIVVFFLGIVALPRIWDPLVFVVAAGAGFGTIYVTIKR